MTITIRKTTRNGHATEHVSTQRCSLCGAKRGEDWELFAMHLATEHSGDEV